MSEYPTRPADIDHRTPLWIILNRLHEHGLALLEHRHGIRPLLAGEAAGHALAELALSHHLADRVLAGKWCCAVDALAAGATAEQVGRAMSLDADLVLIGLARWAADQHRLGLMDGARREQVAALVRGEQS